MSSEVLKFDQNSIRVLAGVTDDSNQYITMLRVDPITKRLKISGTISGGSGTVTSASVVSANGFAGTVATATTTPAITLSTTVTGLLYGNGTAISASTISTGLTLSTSTLTSNISTGVAGGQTIYGGTAANDDLTIEGTSSATKTTSYVNLQPTGGFVGIGMATPGSRLSFGVTIEEKIRLYDSGVASTSYGIGTTSSCTQIFSGAIGDIAISRGGISGTQIARWVGGTNFMALGTITPVAKLHLDSGTATASAIKLTAGTTTGVTATDGINFGITAAGVGEIRQYENQVLNVYTNNTLAATFTTGQDLQVVSAGTTSTSVVTNAATQTLTNKRITKRTGTTTSSATPTINTDNVDFFSVTAQTVDITSFTTNLSGTPTDGQTLWIAITGTAARAITWGSSFESSTVGLPTTTVSTNRLDVGFVWNTATSKWRCIASA